MTERPGETFLAEPASAPKFGRSNHVKPQTVGTGKANDGKCLKGFALRVILCSVDKDFSCWKSLFLHC